MRKEVDQRSEERLALRELDVISDGEKRKIKVAHFAPRLVNLPQMYLTGQQTPGIYSGSHPST